MSYFTPLLEDQPLSYAYDRPKFYRNAAREKKWGAPVYFVPASNGYDVVGEPGPGYKYEKPYNINQGAYGNCTWWVMGRCSEVNGTEIKECIGSAINFYSKYKGKKDGGSVTSGAYIGDTINAGDIIVFADNKQLSGDGHVIFVEAVEGATLRVSESAYSTKSIYKNKACITYSLNKTDFKCGNKITLRPQYSPYTEYVYGVLHTGKESSWVKPEPVERDESKDQLYIGNVTVKIRDEATTASVQMGLFSKPCAYFNVDGVTEKSDYVWYHLGPDAWVAGCDDEIVYYPKEDDKTVKELKEQIKALKAEIATLTDTNNKLAEQVKTLEKQVTTLSNNISTAKELADKIVQL